MLVARPAAVWTSTALHRYTPAERLLLGWAGLRGAVPIVLATFALSSDVPHKETIFNAVFFVVLVSTIVQGTTLEASRSGSGSSLRAPPVPRGAARGRADERARARRLRGRADHAINGSAVRELGLPRDALIAVVNRDGHAIPPRGCTVVRAGDRLFVLVPHRSRPDLEDVFSRWRRLV